MRDAILFNRTDRRLADLAPEEQEPWQRAARVLQEHNLTESRRFTYQDLGYRTADGLIPAWKIRDELYLADVVQEALVETYEDGP